MRFSQLFALVVIVGAVAPVRVAGAEVEAPSKWVKFDQPKLGFSVRHPAAAKVEVKGNDIEISGPELATVKITVAQTTERNTSKSGGMRKNTVYWTIAVPKRSAVCIAETDDPDKATVASSMCDSIELTPGPRDPHIELAVTSSGLADGAAYEKAVRAKGKALDACWKAALAKNPALTEGSLTVKRTYDDGTPSSTNEHAENFFGRDTTALGKCVFGLVEGVPVKTSEKDAQVQLEMICRFY